MAGKRSAIVLDKLDRKAVATMESMMAELTGDAKSLAKPAELSHWSRRFAASGKPVPAPKLRLP
jgi:hypothetical protein